MDHIIKKTKSFISYWYLRYQLATELYMVEPWERAFIHVLFLILFGLFWYFNTTIVLNGISGLHSTKGHIEQMSL